MTVQPAIVCLVGLRCAGKSTVGRALAERLAWPFVDLDEAVVDSMAGAFAPPLLSAGAILAALGEAEFRLLEVQALEATLDRGAPLVLATGGGCVESSPCRQLLVRARTFWLDGPVEVLAARLRADDTLRPSLTGAPPADELALLAERRGPLYAEVCEGTLDARLPAGDLAAEIVERLA